MITTSRCFLKTDFSSTFKYNQKVCYFKESIFWHYVLTNSIPFIALNFPMIYQRWHFSLNAYYCHYIFLLNLLTHWLFALFMIIILEVELSLHVRFIELNLLSKLNDFDHYSLCFMNILCFLGGFHRLAHVLCEKLISTHLGVVRVDWLECCDVQSSQFCEIY